MSGESDMAERVGFEPTVPLQARRFSRPEPKTTRTPLQYVPEGRGLFRAPFKATSTRVVMAHETNAPGGRLGLSQQVPLDTADSAPVKSRAATINLPHARAPISPEAAMVYAALQLMVPGGGAAGITDVYGDDHSIRGTPCLPASRQLRARLIRQPI